MFICQTSLSQLPLYIQLHLLLIVSNINNREQFTILRYRNHLRAAPKGEAPPPNGVLAGAAPP